MFTKLSTGITIPSSPSLQSNNLSISMKQDVICYTHIDEVCIYDLTKNTSIKLPARPGVYQAAFTAVKDVDLLIVTSTEGIEIWSGNGETLLFYYSLANAFDFKDNEDYFSRGIASTNTFACAGTSLGNILVFGSVIETGAKGQSSIDPKTISLVHNLSTNNYAVACLYGSAKYLVCGNDNGDIFTFNSQSAFELCFHNNGFGVACTSLCIRSETIYAGYYSGHIRVFRCQINELSIEVAAHVRPITGLALHPYLNFLASTSEDQYVHVWNAPDFSNKASSTIDLLFTDKINNRMCTGITFLRDERICVACYDSDVLTVYKKE